MRINGAMCTPLCVQHGLRGFGATAEMNWLFRALNFSLPSFFQRHFAYLCGGREKVCAVIGEEMVDIGWC